MRGDRLRQLRENAGLTQRALAQLLGVNPSTIANWENQNREPSHELLSKLAAMFGTTTDYLIGRTDDPRPYPRKRSNVEDVAAWSDEDLQTPVTRANIGKYLRYARGMLTEEDIEIFVSVLEAARLRELARRAAESRRRQST